MRPVRYNVAASLDGYIADAQGAYDWIPLEPAIDFDALFQRVDTVLLGRHSYELVLRDPALAFSRPRWNTPIMYTPRSFAESDLPTLFDYLDGHPLGILVSATTDRLAATHLPLILDRSAGPFGTLFGHLARANPQARTTSPAAADALVIFTGPDAYITPEWYATKHETGRVVPTWNYVAVHAYGRLRLHEDSEFLRDHLERLTHRHEDGRASPWRVSDAPTDYIAQQMKAIVGLSVQIERLEGKWKMSQNRVDADIAGVIAGLEASGVAREQEVASLVAARRPRPTDDG